MKKMYHIPATEIVTLETKRIMQMAGPSEPHAAPAHHLGSSSGGANPF